MVTISRRRLCRVGVRWLVLTRPLIAHSVSFPRGSRSNRASVSRCRLYLRCVCVVDHCEAGKRFPMENRASRFQKPHARLPAPLGEIRQPAGRQGSHRKRRRRQLHGTREFKRSPPVTVHRTVSPENQASFRRLPMHFDRLSAVADAPRTGKPVKQASLVGRSETQAAPRPVPESRVRERRLPAQLPVWARDEGKSSQPPKNCRQILA